jgi:hypothetical protein
VTNFVFANPVASLGHDAGTADVVAVADADGALPVAPAGELFEHPAARTITRISGTARASRRFIGRKNLLKLALAGAPWSPFIIECTVLLS